MSTRPKIILINCLAQRLAQTGRFDSQLYCGAQNGCFKTQCLDYHHP